MLASTTPAECIQERTASGSSFMLAVAPRGKLSWIPNISGAPTLRPPPLLPYDHESKTTRGKNKKKNSKNLRQKEKSSRKAAGLQDAGGRCFLRHRKTSKSESTQRGRNKTQKRGKKRREESRRRGVYSTAQLSVCFLDLIQVFALEEGWTRFPPSVYF